MPTPATLSPARQIIPKIQVLTRQTQTGPPSNVAISLPTAEDQRVGSPPAAHREQRVARPILADSDDTDCPTIIPFTTLPAPGRIALRPGGDNVTYARTLAPLTTVPAIDVPPNCNSESNGRHSTTRSLPIHEYPGTPPVYCLPQKIMSTQSRSSTICYHCCPLVSLTRRARQAHRLCCEPPVPPASTVNYSDTIAS